MMKYYISLLIQLFNLTNDIKIYWIFYFILQLNYGVFFKLWHFIRKITDQVKFYSYELTMCYKLRLYATQTTLVESYAY